jgi:hypothetical protein
MQHSLSMSLLRPRIAVHSQRLGISCRRGLVRHSKCNALLGYWVGQAHPGSGRSDAKGKRIFSH